MIMSIVYPESGMFSPPGSCLLRYKRFRASSPIGKTSASQNYKDMLLVSAGSASFDSWLSASVHEMKTHNGRS